MIWKKDISAETAQAYRDSFTSIIGEYTDASEKHPVVSSMRLQQSSFLLDAGCGSGRYLAEAAQDQPFVGMDLSLEMVKLARDDLKRGFFVVGELEHLPFLDAVFNEVISVRVLQHIRDQEKAVLEMARVCKPGVDVIVLALNSWTFHCLYKNIRMSPFIKIANLPFRLVGKQVDFSWQFDYDNYCSLPELSGMFKRAGLKVVERKGGTIGHPWVFRALGLGRLQRYAPGPLRLYFKVCRFVEDRLGSIFPFAYFLDKVIVKGIKQ